MTAALLSSPIADDELHPFGLPIEGPVASDYEDDDEEFFEDGEEFEDDDEPYFDEFEEGDDEEEEYSDEEDDEEL